MKATIFIATAILLSACSTYRAYEYPESYAFSPSDELFEIPPPVARMDAEKLAVSDFHKGVYRILFFGYPLGESQQERYLRRKYAVYSIPIGCVVSDSVIAFTESYNATMRPLLISHFQKDIFTQE